jgi:hypothetical protein
MLTSINSFSEPVMQTTCVQVTIPLWRPLHVRVWAHIAGMARARWREWLRARHERAQWVRLRCSFDGLQALDPHTLRDIGAPESMVSGAIARREMDAHRIDRFSTWRGV